MGGIFPGSRGPPTLCGACVSTSPPAGTWSVSAARGCWHVTWGVGVGISLMCVCGGQRWCSLLNTVGERHANISIPVGKGKNVCVSVRVFVKVSASDSVCIRVGQHVCASMKVR